MDLHKLLLSIERQNLNLKTTEVFLENGELQKALETDLKGPGHQLAEVSLGLGACWPQLPGLGRGGTSEERLLRPAFPISQLLPACLPTYHQSRVYISISGSH